MLLKVREGACDRNIQFCFGTLWTHHRLACFRKGRRIQGVQCGGNVKGINILKILLASVFIYWAWGMADPGVQRVI